MRIFVTFRRERLTVDVETGVTVGQMKREIRDKFSLVGDDGTHEKKFLVLTFAGSTLQDEWVFSDIGILPGSTIKCALREVDGPTLFVYTAFNGETVTFLDKINFVSGTVSDVRSLVTRRTGLPIGIYRLLAPGGKEMFDCNTLDFYKVIRGVCVCVGGGGSMCVCGEGYGPVLPIGIYRLLAPGGREMFDCNTQDFYKVELGATLRLETWDGWTEFLMVELGATLRMETWDGWTEFLMVELGATLRLETWDGWTEFLQAATRGQAGKVLLQVAENDMVQRYQYKVALYIAGHYGHADLATSVLKYGAKPDEPIGMHPFREWCDQDSHPLAIQPAIHHTAETGQVSVLRVMIQYNPSCLACKFQDKNALSVALLAGKREAAIYLISKYWSPVTINNISMSINMYAKVRRWAEGSRERVFLQKGSVATSLKRSPHKGALVGQGVNIDGFTSSQMTSKTKAEMRQQAFRAMPGANKLPPMPALTSRFSKTLLTMHKDKLHREQEAESVTPKRSFAQTDSSTELQLPNIPPGGAKKLKLRSLLGKKESPGGTDELPPGQGASAGPKKLPMKFGAAKTASESPCEDAATPKPTGGLMGKLAGLKKPADKPEESKTSPSLGGRLLGKLQDGTSTQGSPVDTAPPPAPAAGRFKLKSLFGKLKGGQNSEASQEGEAATGGATGNFIETGKDKLPLLLPKLGQVEGQTDDLGGKQRSKTEGALPLPALEKSFIRRRSKTEEMRRSTLALFELYRGQTAHEKAVGCMAIANTFKEKPWLHQVHLAVTLAKQSVQRSLEKGRKDKMEPVKSSS
ncbi:ANKUB1 [Branchiostoma lanceolatum]|uniref:ANKUB1 protein n=1 Tax=Branchiostoma lanceolatum TaxID=7740 RepID=A0A8J9WEF7_BRALA|nr:ANKUB1 [Branchiostoma lanceolatum]